MAAADDVIMLMPLITLMRADYAKIDAARAARCCR